MASVLPVSVERELIGVCKADLLTLRERLANYIQQLQPHLCLDGCFDAVILTAVTEMCSAATATVSHEQPAECTATPDMLAPPALTRAGRHRTSGITSGQVFETARQDAGYPPVPPPLTENSRERGLDPFRSRVISASRPDDHQMDSVDDDDDGCFADEGINQQNGFPLAMHLKQMCESDGMDEASPSVSNDVSFAAADIRADIGERALGLGPSSTSDAGSIIGTEPTTTAADVSHLFDVHADALVQQSELAPDGRYVCAVADCRLSFSSRTNLARHVKQVHTLTAEVFRCLLCPYETNESFSHFRKHVFRKHEFTEFGKQVRSFIRKEYLAALHDGTLANS